MKLWYDFWFEITSANIPNTKRLTFDCPPFDQEFSNVGTMGLHFGIWGLFQPYFDDVVVFQNKPGISNSGGGGSKGGGCVAFHDHCQFELVPNEHCMGS